MKTEIKIYLITCVTTGKKYVGITTKTLARRWVQHRSQAKQKTGFIFHKAINHYGPEAFRIEHLASALTWEDACELEKAFIVEYAAKHPQGYNTHTGGNGLDILRLKDKISASHKGFRHTEETKAWMRLRHQEKLKDPAYRESLRRGARQRVFLEIEKQRLVSVRANNFKPVVCNWDGRQFESLMTAADYYGVDRKHLSAVVRGRKKTVRGLSFSYLNPDQRRAA